VEPPVDPTRVLIVDDDELIREWMEGNLPPRGFDVECAGDGDAALALLRNSSFDVVVLDEVMPEMSGLEVLRRIRELPDRPEVLFLTAHRSIDSAIEAMKLGARDYLEKPCKVDELDMQLQRAAESRRLNQRVSLYEGALGRHDVPKLTCSSKEMTGLMRVLSKCAPTDTTVLIQGETGVGKELVAHELYRRSLRSDKPFLPVNCGALSEQLLESELFGHEKGAFTGAAALRHGLFEVADGGTIFLDEIGEMPPNTQVKLLRVLQSGEIRRVGGNRVIHVDVRVIASTNKDLAKATQAGEFREDLYYRLSVLTLHVPPLRERREEIPQLVREFVENAAARHDRPIEVSDGALNLLMKHDWPGNVRELENIIELAVVLSDDSVIRTSNLPPNLLAPRLPGSGGAGPSPLSLEQVEHEHLLRVLDMNKGNKRKTARDLGIDTKTLYNKLKKIEAAAQT
jgi:DNA-binding NtrC family response regulator